MLLYVVISIVLLVLLIVVGVRYYVIREENMNLEAQVEAYSYLRDDNSELKDENLRLSRLNAEYKKLIDDHSISIKKAINDDEQKDKIDSGRLYLHSDDLLVKGIRALEGKEIE